LLRVKEEQCYMEGFDLCLVQSPFMQGRDFSPITIVVFPVIATFVQEEQLEQAVSNAAAETDAKLVQEMQQREEALSNALLEARASLGNMQRLHQASQNQLFTIQSQTEEQEVCLTGLQNLSFKSHLSQVTAM